MSGWIPGSLMAEAIARHWPNRRWRFRSIARIGRYSLLISKAEYMPITDPDEASMTAAVHLARLASQDRTRLNFFPRSDEEVRP